MRYLNGAMRSAHIAPFFIGGMPGDCGDAWNASTRFLTTTAGADVTF